MNHQLFLTDVGYSTGWLRQTLPFPPCTGANCLRTWDKASPAIRADGLKLAVIHEGGYNNGIVLS
jgi:hypothetical protein